MASQEPAAKRLKTSKTATTSDTIIWRIFPPLNGKPTAFAANDLVFFRPKSNKERGRRGTVVEPSDSISETAKDHVWVQFASYTNSDQEEQEASNKRVSCKRLVPVFSQDPNTTLVILTPETIPYRQLAQSQVDKTDDILEIGCSTGEASAILLRYGRSWVGFDTSTDMIERCKAHIKSSFASDKSSESKSWHAVKMDPLSDPKRALDESIQFSSPLGPTCVFLDIGGNRESESVIQMMSWVLGSFSKLRLMVVKSRALHSNLPESNSPKSCNVDPTTGLFATGQAWFQKQVEASTSSRRALPRHPLQAPLVFAPNDKSTPICRYYNYHQDGCSKQDCPYDHKHCHLCLQPGHVALNCKQGFLFSTTAHDATSDEKHI